MLIFAALQFPKAWVVPYDVNVSLYRTSFPCYVHCNGTLLGFICRWITPVLLLIDFYEKMAVSSKRRAQMNKVCAR